MLVKCKHCGNEQEYKVRSDKIPKRPKTTCNNKTCKKEIYIKKELLTEKTEKIDMALKKPIKIEKSKIPKPIIKPKREIIGGLEDTITFSFVEDNIKEIIPIKDLLYPPKTPKPIITPKREIIGGLEDMITITMKKSDLRFYKFATSSDFKRAVYLYLEGKSWRGSNEDLEKTVNKKIEIMKELSIKNPNYGDVIKEFKELLKKREEKKKKS